MNVCQLLFECYHPPVLQLNLTLDRKLWTQSEEGSLNQNSKIHDEFRVSYGHRRHSNLLVFSEKNATLLQLIL